MKNYVGDGLRGLGRLAGHIAEGTGMEGPDGRREAWRTAGFFAAIVGVAAVSALGAYFCSRVPESPAVNGPPAIATEYAPETR